MPLTAQRKPSSIHYSEIFAPFQKISINDVRSCYNGKAIADSIFFILNTRKGERVMLPAFGCDLHDYLFEPIDMQTSLDIELEIRDALERWEPRAIIDTINVIPNYDNNSYTCSVRFHIRNLDIDLQEVKLDLYSSYY